MSNPIFVELIPEQDTNEKHTWNDQSKEKSLETPEDFHSA